MNPEIIFWIVALVLFLAVEGATAGLVSIWFAAGAIFGLISAALGAPVWLQIVLFLVVTGITLILTRPLVSKYTKGKKVSTNADMYIGQEGVVLQDIDNLKATGLVKVRSFEWTARSTNDEPIAEGTLVRAVRIEGVKLIVEPVPAGIDEEVKV